MCEHVTPYKQESPPFMGGEEVKKNKIYFSLLLWIVALILIGSIIGSLTKPEINNWYSTLNRSPLTPANYVFPVAWTILYGAIGASGWLIWHTKSFSKLFLIKTLYVIQLILNWSWTPLFFHYHLTGLSLLILGSMDILVGILIWLAYPKIRTASALMIPYFLWILFATHLNFYIWQYNY
jgi:translocator protein